MKKEDKLSVVNTLVELIGQYPNMYLTDIEAMSADMTSNLRRACFQKDVKLVVVKNTLLKKAMKQVDETIYEPLFATMKGSTAVMFAETANAPAKLIKDFNKSLKNAGSELIKPVLKGAYVQEGIYIGAEQLETLVNIKSKEELLGDIVTLLESPIKNVISALDSAGGTIHGVLQTLEERN